MGNCPGLTMTGLSLPTTQRTPRQLLQRRTIPRQCHLTDTSFVLLSGLTGLHSKNYPCLHRGYGFHDRRGPRPGQTAKGLPRPLNKPSHIPFYLLHRRWRFSSLLALLNADAMASHISPNAVSYNAQASMWPDLNSSHVRATIPRTS